MQYLLVIRMIAEGIVRPKEARWPISSSTLTRSLQLAISPLVDATSTAITGKPSSLSMMAATSHAASHAIDSSAHGGALIQAVPLSFGFGEHGRIGQHQTHHQECELDQELHDFLLHKLNLIVVDLC